MSGVPDPFSAVVQKLSRRDSSSTLIALMLGYVLVSFALAAGTAGWLRLLIGITGAVAFTTGIAAFGYTFIFKPERLRTEEMARMDMVLAWLTRSDVDDEQRSAAARLLPIVMEAKRGKAENASDQGKES